MMAVLLVTACGPDDLTRDDWLEAPVLGSDSTSSDGPTRCDAELGEWFTDHVTDGMTRDEVRRAVGDPDSASPNVLRYDLGFCVFDPEWFEVRFADGQVVDVLRQRG